jgi:hypothetical protein
MGFPLRIIVEGREICKYMFLLNNIRFIPSPRRISDAPHERNMREHYRGAAFVATMQRRPAGDRGQPV